jgi:excisionase family DNA binding protein
MENPFEILNRKLDRIIVLLEQRWSVKVPEKTPGEKDIMDIEETAVYLGCSRQTIYGYTSRRTIPHFKMHKRVMFRKQELIDWITEGRVKTVWEIQKEADSILIRKKRRKGR